MKTHILNGMPAYLLAELDSLSRQSFYLIADSGKHVWEFIFLLEVDISESLLIAAGPPASFFVDGVKVLVRQKEYLELMGREKLNEQEECLLDRLKAFIEAIKVYHRNGLVSVNTSSCKCIES